MSLSEFEYDDRWILRQGPRVLNDEILQRRNIIMRQERVIEDAQNYIERTRDQLMSIQHVLDHPGESIWRFYELCRPNMQDAWRQLLKICTHFDLKPYDLVFGQIEGVTINVVDHDIKTVFKLLLDAFVWTRLVNDGDHAIATRVLGFL